MERVALMMGRIEDYQQRLFGKAKRWLKPFLIITAIYLVGISAIIRANFNYIDDMGRVFSGYGCWSIFSRFLSEYLAKLIHASSYLTDVSPLTQFLAVLFMSTAAVILLAAFNETCHFSFFQYVSIVPLALSPYFLECLSYKYDSPYMALSVLAAIAPIAFRNKGNLWYGIAAALGTIAVCTTYQAASGIFPMVVIALALHDWLKGKQISAVLKQSLSAAAGYIIGMIVFVSLIMQPAESYVSNTVSPGQIVQHWVDYYRIIISDFKTSWLLIIAVIFLAYLVSAVFNTSRGKIPALLMGVGSLAAMALVAFGAYPMLETPSYEPRAMYGFGAMIAICAVAVSSEKHMYIGKAATLMIAWMFFVFSFTYGNALYVQKQYTDYRITMVAEDLNEIMPTLSDETKMVQITGSIGYAPAIRNMPKSYNMLTRLVPVTFMGGGWWWGYCGLNFYYDINNIEMSVGTNFKELDLPVLKETDLYTISGNDTCILISLRE